MDFIKYGLGAIVLLASMIAIAVFLIFAWVAMT